MFNMLNNLNKKRGNQPSQIMENIKKVVTAFTKVELSELVLYHASGCQVLTTKLNPNPGVKSRTGYQK